jgi:apolipoprotein N-acyltransferase
MLTVIQPPFGLAPLAWVALVPFVLACSPSVSFVGLAVIAYVISLFYWLGNLYWLAPVTASGWLAFCLYTALLWPLLVYGIRFCRAKKLPLFLCVPVLFVGAERLQGLFLGGFFWRHLSHSQYANITLIQIADIFGAAGISFLIAMVNGLIAGLALAAGRKKLLSLTNLLKVIAVCSAVLITFAYGRWRIGQSGKFICDGPLVAAVQSNVPQSVKQSFQAEETIFDDLLAESTDCLRSGAELLVWPETMVQANLDPQVLKVADASYEGHDFDRLLREHARDNAWLLVGAYGGRPQIFEDGTVRLAAKYNSAFLYTPAGTQSHSRYDKIHLVPFGEFVPFKKSCPLLYNLLLKFTPYDYDYSLDYGSQYTVFEVGSLQRPYRFGVMICYEDAVPALARRLALDDSGTKNVDWLVNISNDGWFVRFDGHKFFPSTELAQHTAVCVFRAVENRLAVLRSVNTGISCIIDTVGRTRNGFLAGTLPAAAMSRTGCSGWFADRMPLDRRFTFFSKYGQWLDFFCAICLIFLIIIPHIRLKGLKNRCKK